jgi:putative colanic acid biosynthesis glycosyltransferase
MNSKNIVFSIITVNLNNADGLGKTIESIRCQTYKCLEYIIIDGNSTDSSLEVIQQNGDIISYYVSESDHGLYDAMNKGLDKATGDFVLFLNSGDVFYNNDVLSDVSNNISGLGFVYFGCAKIFNDDTSFYIYPKFDSKEDEIVHFLKYRKPNHQAMFFPRIFYTTARYNIQYKVSGDEDYKIRAIQCCGYVFINKIIVSFLLGGISFPKSILKVREQLRELDKIHKINKVYTFRKHILYAVTLFIKYLFNVLFGSRSYMMLIKYSNIKYLLKGIVNRHA